MMTVAVVTVMTMSMNVVVNGKHNASWTIVASAYKRVVVLLVHTVRVMC